MILVLSGPSNHAKAQEAFSLELGEVTPTPGVAEVTGATMATSGLVLWSTHRQELWFVNGGVEARSLAPFAPVGVHVLGDTIWVGDRASRSLIAIRPEGMETILSLPEIGDLESVLRTDEAWYFLLSASGGHPDSTRTILRWNGKTPSPQRIHRVKGAIRLATLTNGRLAIARFDPPFETRIIDAGGETVEKWCLDDEVAHALGEGGRLVTLKPIELDRGMILQQVSDLTSDRRLLIRLGPGGSTRGRVVNASMGFVASDPLRQRLIAYLEEGVGSVLTYQWRWSDQEFEHREILKTRERMR